MELRIGTVAMKFRLIYYLEKSATKKEKDTQDKIRYKKGEN